MVSSGVLIGFMSPMINALAVLALTWPLKGAMDWKSIVDLRTRRLFAQHRAWFSFDDLRTNKSTTDAEITECYRWLAKLLAEMG